MKKIILFSTLVILSLPVAAKAHDEDGDLAYRTCRGMVTSNNSCIGSESNVNSRSNHEPYYSSGRRGFGRPSSGRSR